MASKKSKKSLKKEKKTRNRKPKVHHVYEEMDKLVAQQVEADQKAMRGMESRVLGLSFTDYAEYKFMGADGVHDPFIQKYMNVNIPRNYTPHMRTEPVNVVLNQQNVIQAIKPFTASEMKAMTTNFGTEQMNIKAKTGATTYSVKADTRIIWPKYYQNPYQYQD